MPAYSCKAVAAPYTCQDQHSCFSKDETINPPQSGVHERQARRARVMLSGAGENIDLIWLIIELGLDVMAQSLTLQQ